jgi:hypothetical protein
MTAEKEMMGKLKEHAALLENLDEVQKMLSKTGLVVAVSGIGVCVVAEQCGEHTAEGRLLLEVARIGTEFIKAVEVYNAHIEKMKQEARKA